MAEIALDTAQPAMRRARLNEDWLAVVIGLLIYALALASLFGTDLLGWSVTTSVYRDVTTALAPVAKTYASFGGLGSLLATYATLLLVLSIGIAALGAGVVAGWAVVRIGTP